jgi:hypothetical protein
LAAEDRLAGGAGAGRDDDLEAGALEACLEDLSAGGVGDEDGGAELGGPCDRLVLRFWVRGDASVLGAEMTSL